VLLAFGVRGSGQIKLQIDNNLIVECCNAGFVSILCLKVSRSMQWNVRQAGTIRSDDAISSLTLYIVNTNLNIFLVALVYVLFCRQLPLINQSMDLIALPNLFIHCSLHLRP